MQKTEGTKMDHGVKVVRKRDFRTQKEWFTVEVTFRECFEYFFEIAHHHFQFEAVYDANKLAEKVRAAFKEIGLSKSKSFALARDRWIYTSSAYTGRMEGCPSYEPRSASKAAVEAARQRDYYGK
jgi:hypothetical protein